MLKNFIRGEFVEDAGYELIFDDGHGTGFGFPCDTNGNVDLTKLNDMARENLQFCMAHPEKFKRFGEVTVWRVRWREHDRGICHCGQVVELVNEYMGACQCQKCGQWYNLFGQELLPPEDWDMDDEDY